MGCFPVDSQEAKRPLRTKSLKRPIKVGKRPINEGKRPIKAMVLVGIPVGCLMGCFRAPRRWWTTAPLKRSIKRSMMSERCFSSLISASSHPLPQTPFQQDSMDAVFWFLCPMNYMRLYVKCRWARPLEEARSPLSY